MPRADVDGDFTALVGHWIVFYDADCGFCNWLLAWLLRWDRRQLLCPRALDRPEAATLLADLTPPQRTESWHLISPDGARRSGGAALPTLLRLLPGGAIPGVLLERAPRLTDRSYRWVADHRRRLSRMVPSASRHRARELVRRREAMFAPGPR
jgi:predicted DCC family thiol-disulfide oxidoreductase YuxK